MPFDPSKPFDKVSAPASKFDPDKEFEVLDDSEGPGRLESLGRGALQGISLGYADEIAGAIEAALTDKTYTQSRDEARSSNSKAQEANPWTYGAGELGGGATTLLVPGAAGVGAGLKGAAALGAAGALGSSSADLTKGEYGGALVDTAIGGTIGAVTQKFIPGAIDKVKSVVGPGSKKAGSILFGVGEEATDRYLANPDKMRAVISEGPDGLRAIKDTIDEAYFTKVTRVREDAAAGLVDAKEARKEAGRLHQDYLAELKNMKPHESLADEVIGNVKNENNKLTQLSSEAYDTLDGLQFDRTEVLGKINQIKGSLLVDGKKPMIGDAAPAWGVLERLELAVKSGDLPRLDSLMNQADEIPGIAGRDVKKLIQQLDQESSAAYTTYGSRGAAKYIKGVRDEIDPILKAHKPYAEAMVSTADQAALVNQLTDIFGDPEKARRALLMTADPEKGPNVLAYIKTLDRKNKTNVADGLNEYLNAQKILKDPETRLANQRMALNPSDRALQEAQNTAKAANDLRAKFNRVAPGSSEGTIEKVGRGRNIEGEKQLKELVGEQGLEDVMDFSLGKDFVTDKTRGARRTAAGAIAGGAVGSLLGPAGTAIGTSLGGAAGATIDRVGGQIWQKVLDGALKIGPYAKVLENAAKSGTASLNATHIYLMKNYPEYKAAVESSPEI